MNARRQAAMPPNPAMDRAVDMVNAAFAVWLVLDSPLSTLHPHDRAMLLQIHLELSWPFAHLENETFSLLRDRAGADPSRTRGGDAA